MKKVLITIVIIFVLIAKAYCKLTIDDETEKLSYIMRILSKIHEKFIWKNTYIYFGTEDDYGVISYQARFIFENENGTIKFLYVEFDES